MFFKSNIYIEVSISGLRAAGSKDQTWISEKKYHYKFRFDLPLFPTAFVVIVDSSYRE